MEFDIGYGAAAFAGLLSFLSPCMLPIVPFYLCYLAGMSFDALADEDELPPADRRHIFMATVLFAAGVATVFFGLGASATYFGQALREWFDVLKYAAAAIILTGPGRIAFDGRRGWATRPRIGSFLALVVGIAAGVCIWIFLNGANPVVR